MQSLVQKLLLPVLFLLTWELLSRAGLSYESFSRPSAIFAQLVVALGDGTMLYATRQTFQAALYGLVMGSAVGVALGLVLGLSRIAQRLFDPTLELIRNIPAVSVLPLLLMIFGLGLNLEAGIVAFGCVWPLLFVAVVAIRGVEPRLMDVARVLRMPLHLRLIRIVFPAIVARLWVGLRIAAGFALIIAVTIEIIINPYGLGSSMMHAADKLQLDLMWAHLIWIAFLGWALNAVLEAIERTWFSRFVIVGAK